MLVTVIPLAISGVLYTSKFGDSVERAVSRRLEDQGRFISDQLGRFIQRKRHSMTEFARVLDLAAADKLRERLNLITQADSEWSWLAVADLSGRVLASSDKAPNMPNVFYRQWFRGGMKAPYVGDLYYDEPLPAEGLQSTPRKASSNRHMQFAVPVKGPDGRTIAVLGGSLDCERLKEALVDIGGQNVEVIVLSKNRNVLFGPAALEESGTSFGLAIPASEPGPVARVVQSVDGGPHYLTVQMPEVSCSDLPSFGWSLILRENVEHVFAGVQGLFKAYWRLTAGSALVILAGLYLTARYVSQPVAEAAGFATKLAGGGDAGLPPEPSGGRETHALIAALTRLQSSLQSKPLPAAPPATSLRPEGRRGARPTAKPVKFRRLRQKLARLTG
jgi:hypothetical protein